MADTKTNMMGSKADMISSKFDEVRMSCAQQLGGCGGVTDTFVSGWLRSPLLVPSCLSQVARNSIWREHLAKEQRTVPKSTKFVLNPSTSELINTGCTPPATIAHAATLRPPPSPPSSRAVIPITRKPGEKVERPKHTTDDADFSTYFISAGAKTSRGAVQKMCAHAAWCAFFVVSEELQATMKRSTMMPQAKSRYPMTASQEVG